MSFTSDRVSDLDRHRDLAGGQLPDHGGSGTLTAKNYSFVFTPGTLTVTQATASAYTITWPSQSIVYGTAIGGASGIKATASIAGSFSYSPAAGTVLPVSATPVVVTATFTPTDTTDYAGQTATASITVTPAVLTVKAVDATRAYGAADPTFTDTITGYVNGDTSSVITGTASLTSTDTATSPVGSYPITAAVGTLTAKNYSFVFTPGTLTVTQATASAYTITWPSQSIVYGTAIGGASGIKATASIAGSFSYSPAAGTVLPVSATPVVVTATFTPTDTTDYAGQTATASITVTPAVLTVKAVDATRAYGAADPTFTDTITGYVNGDTSSVITGTASLTSTDTATSPVGSYPITAAVGTLTAKNYSFVFTPGTLTVTQATASAYTITWPSQSIVYGTAIGGASGIKATASIAGSFSYSPAAGTVLPVSATPVVVTATFTPTDTTDYAGQSATASITVTPAVLTVKAVDATRAYGASDPTFTDTITGYVNGDTSSVVTGAASLTSTDTATSPVGSYPITAAVGTLTAKNYSFVFTPGTLTVTQATASAYTITWPSQSIVYGTAIGGASGIKATASIAGSFSYSPAAGTVLPVSATPVVVTATFTPTDTTDYAGQTATASITVTPAVLTVKAVDATRAYGAADPTFTDTITGYVNGDTSSVITGTASLTSTDTATSPVGSYPITAAVGTLTAKNYSFVFTPGTLTVTQATASAYTITWPSQSIVYGTAIGGASGIKATASIAGSFSYSPAAGTVLPVSATPVVVTATFTPTDTTDYAGQSATASITVTPAVLTVKAVDATRAYGAADPTFTDTITGYVNGDTSSVITGDRVSDLDRHRHLAGGQLPDHGGSRDADGQELQLRLHPRDPDRDPGHGQRVHHHLAEPEYRLRDCDRRRQRDQGDGLDRGQLQLQPCGRDGASSERHSSGRDRNLHPNRHHRLRGPERHSQHHGDPCGPDGQGRRCDPCLWRG